MIIPDHWAEARKQHRSADRQVTVLRYGWSTVSEAGALAMAAIELHDHESRAHVADTVLA